jgi:hypothetical protein
MKDVSKHSGSLVFFRSFASLYLSIVIACDIEKLTDHWDAKSAARAVASVAPGVDY